MSRELLRPSAVTDSVAKQFLFLVSSFTSYLKRVQHYRNISKHFSNRKKIYAFQANAFCV